MTVGVYNLAAEQITVARTADAMSAITDLGGMTAVTLVAQFSYGSGGTTAAAVVQTSFDGGTTWVDIARFDFTTASAVKVATLSGSLSKAVTAAAALGSEGVFDSTLGDRLRAVLTTTGTYANTLLRVDASVR